MCRFDRDRAGSFHRKFTDVIVEDSPGHEEGNHGWARMDTDEDPAKETLPLAPIRRGLKARPVTARADASRTSGGPGPAATQRFEACKADTTTRRIEPRSQCRPDRAGRVLGCGVPGAPRLARHTGLFHFRPSALGR